jgi:hypothetical protein
MGGDSNTGKKNEKYDWLPCKAEDSHFDRDNGGGPSDMGLTDEP